MGITTRGVGSMVMILDENGAPVPDAAVSVHWDLPGGGKGDQVGTTNSSGRATFKINGGSGTYTITITDVTLSGYTFDPAGSRILTSSITK
jgi:hypothetical protein